MLAREEDEVYPITYIISLFFSTVPCPQLVQSGEILVQLMGFAAVFTIWGSGQSCFLWQLRSFALLFLTTPVGFNFLLCQWDCYDPSFFICGVRSTFLPFRIQPLAAGCSLSSGMSKSVPNPANQGTCETMTQLFHSAMGTAPEVYHKCVVVASIPNRSYHICQREVFPIFPNTVLN